MADHFLLDKFLLSQAPMLTGDIDKKITPMSPWLSQFPKEAWPDEIGHTILNAIWERTFPATEEAWETLVDPTGTNNICIPTPDLAEFKQIVRNTSLATKAVKSPEFCIDDLKVQWKRKQQMGLVVRTLAQVTKEYNIKRNRNKFQAACAKKVVADASLTETGEDSLVLTTEVADLPAYFAGDPLFPDSEPTSIVTHGILDHFHSYLDREGAGEFAAAQEGGGFIYKLITSAEHSRWLRKDDAAVRTDFRESSMSDVLLKGLGITQTYNGYVHVIDPLPRRFTYAMGSPAATAGWTEVFPWINADLTPGEPLHNKFIQNPAYATAPFEDLAIMIPGVVMMMVPIPVDSVGRAKFKAQNYQGDFKWLNIPHATDNPLGNLGFFYGRITNGFQTRHPEFGITIRHQRAPLELDMVDVTV